MNWADHPLPHFHAKYGNYEITVEIETGVVLGEFPKRALRAVLEWLDEHKMELVEGLALGAAAQATESDTTIGVMQ